MNCSQMNYVRDVEEVTKNLKRFEPGVDSMDLGAEQDSKREEKHDGTTVSGEDVEFYVERKYHYAGGNTRFIYRFTMDNLVEELNFHFARVTNWEVFTSNDLPGAEQAAVNTLMQQSPDAAGFPQCVAVSRYVLLHASERCSGRLVDAVYAMANLAGNPSLQGWAFELSQLELIKTVFKTIRASDATAAAEDVYIGTKDGLAFAPRDETTYDGDMFPSNWKFLDDETTIIWCLKWNQDCFDVALYKKGTLITLQFTRQDDHSLKLQFITRLRKAIKDTGKEVEKVIHIGVVEADVTTFRFKAAEGTGRSNCEMEYIVKICHASPLEKIQSPTAHETKETLELALGYKISIHYSSWQ